MLTRVEPLVINHDNHNNNITYAYKSRTFKNIMYLRQE